MRSRTSFDKYADIAAGRCPSIRDKTVTPHTLRHTCAMNLLQSGTDVATIALWLGHASVKSTDVYLHADLTLKEQALARTAPTPAAAPSISTAGQAARLPREPVVMPGPTANSRTLTRELPNGPGITAHPALCTARCSLLLRYSGWLSGRPGRSRRRSSPSGARLRTSASTGGASSSPTTKYPGSWDPRRPWRGGGRAWTTPGSYSWWSSTHSSTRGSSPFMGLWYAAHVIDRLRSRGSAAVPRNRLAVLRTCEWRHREGPPKSEQGWRTSA